MTEQFQLDDTYTISDLETLKVISDPFRLRILEQMGPEPVTVKQIAERLNLSPKKLYYHIKMLEEHELIHVVDTQVVSGIIEKWYLIRAHSFVVDRSLLAVTDDAGEGPEFFKQLLSSIFEVAREEIIDAVQAGLILTENPEKAQRTLYLCQSRLYLTEEQRDSFVNRLNDLITDYESQDKRIAGQPYGLTIVSYPVANVGQSSEEEDVIDE